MPSVFLNGQFIDRDSATVSAFDAAMQHGVGLFETMLAVNNGGEVKPGDELSAVSAWDVIDLEAHLDRLIVSARELGLSESLRAGALGEAVKRTAARASAAYPESLRLRVRLTITGGDLNLLDKARHVRDPKSKEALDHQPTLIIAATPATQYPNEMFDRGVMVTIADWKANPLDHFQGHKTVNYWARLRELQIAASKRAGEALVFQVSNHLAGGCVSNVILVKDGVAITPIARGEESEAAGHEGVVGDVETSGRGRVIMPSPVLPGITRRWALDWCAANDVEVVKRMVSIDDVLHADEVLLTNSSWGVLPVVQVESHGIGAGEPGTLGGELVQAWRERTGLDD
ncbi:MAG TPA: aminotransferase class IV [Phycisphaerales bacterium]